MRTRRHTVKPVRGRRAPGKVERADRRGMGPGSRGMGETIKRKRGMRIPRKAAPRPGRGRVSEAAEGQPASPPCRPATVPSPGCAAKEARARGPNRLWRMPLSRLCRGRPAPLRRTMKGRGPSHTARAKCDPRVHKILSSFFAPIGSGPDIRYAPPALEICAGSSNFVETGQKGSKICIFQYIASCLKPLYNTCVCMGFRGLYHLSGASRRHAGYGRDMPC